MRRQCRTLIFAIETMKVSDNLETFRLNSTSYRFVAKSLLVDRHQGLLSLVLMKELAGKYSEGAIF